MLIVTWSLNSITIPEHVYPQSSKRGGEKKRKMVRCNTYNDSGSPHTYEDVNYRFINPACSFATIYSHIESLYCSPV